MEYLRDNNFPFLEIKTLEMLIVRKHLWCSRNSKIFNRAPENRFNNHQYATHIEQLIDVLDNLYACIFCTKTEFLPF